MMVYLIKIHGHEPLKLTPDEWADLTEAVRRHETQGYRDGDTRYGRVHIVECGNSANQMELDKK